MQISDIHVGHRMYINYLIDSLEKAKKFNPDFVAYTGDFVINYNEIGLKEKLVQVSKYFVKGKSGTAAVLGNHDYGKNWSQREVAVEISPS